VLVVRVETRPVRRCPACRGSWPFDWEYCWHCNVWLPGNEATERRILLVPVDTGHAVADPPALPEAREPLVLACEVRCPTELPSPEDLREGREIFQAFTATIADFGGVVRVVPNAGAAGDWRGGPRHVDAALRAVVAAVQASARDGSQSARERRVTFGIGIAAGGGPTFSATQLAFRLCSLANPDTALVCRATYESTRQRFDYRGVGPIVPHSDPLPELVFQLVGPKPERSGSRHGGPERAPLIGRGELLRILDQCREQVESGQCVVLHLIGEPGSGKSKLLREWLAASDRVGRFSGWLRLDTDGVPYGGFPLRAWERLAAPVDGGGEPARSPARALTPGELRQRLQASRRPALIVVDDLHWVDGPSRSALTELLRGLADLPALAVLAYRPSFAAAAPEEPAGLHRKLRLSGLTRAAMRALLAQLAVGPGIDLSPAQRKEIVIRARGNPLYAHEALAHLADVVGRTGSDPLPSSLPDLVIGRIEWTLAHALPELERRHREGLVLEGMRFGLSLEREAILRQLDALEERLASWLDRLDVIEGEAQAVVRKFLQGLDAIDGRLALLSLFLGRQRPHCGRLAQALGRLGAGREDASRGGPSPDEGTGPRW